MYSSAAPGAMSGIPSAMPQITMGLENVDMADLDPTAITDRDASMTFSQLAGPPQDQTIQSLSNTMGQGNNNGLSVVGGGPPPTGFQSLQNATGTGSTLTEFTKRRNWSKLVLEELRDLMLVLSSDGRIQHVSASCKMLTGYESYMLLGKFAGDFIHADDKGMFVREFNESIASGNQMRFFYRLRKHDGSFKIFEAFGHPHHSSEAFSYGRGGAPYCRGYFMMSRPYPTKNAALLDSFLDHKIENERLLKRIAELKKEEMEEEQEQESLWRSQDMTASGSMQTGDVESSSGAIMHDNMPPPARPIQSSNALTRQNLDEALAAARPDSINDKMARYEGASHIETIEMLTGLRYRDGERSQGISTGAPSPALIRGDAGIAILADRDSRMSTDRKKKTKVADEYVCTDCGTLDSPEWRKGPNGPKTLCNACGLRWAKKEKKRQQTKPGLSSSLPKGASTSS